MTRHAFILPHQEMAVFWAPKAACSTLAEVIALSVLDKDVIESWDFDTGGPRALLEAQGMLTTGLEAQKIATHLKYQTHAILRDPYDRLISAFVNKFIRKNDTAITRFADMEAFAFRFLQHNAAKLGLPHAPSHDDNWTGMTFRRFLNAICDVIDESCEQNRLLNQHWNTQIPEVFRAQNLNFDAVYDLKTLPNFFETLFARTGNRVKIPARNASSYDRGDAVDLCDVNTLEIVKMTGVSKACFEDAALRKRVQKSFAIDYHYLNETGQGANSTYAA